MASYQITPRDLPSMQDDDDDDNLSYSSTEHDVSAHEGPISNAPGPLSLSIATGQKRHTVNVVRLQDQLREVQRRLDKERSAKSTLEAKRKNTEKEKAELIGKLEDVIRARSGLEQTKIDLDAKIRNLQYSLNEETEKRKNFELLYNKTKDQMVRKDEQYTTELEAKQKAELSMRNLQMELRTVQLSVKQFEEEREDLTQRIQREQNQRLLQEQINQDQVKFQQTISEDLNRSDVQSETLNRLDAADDSFRHAKDSADRLKAELYATKMELDRLKARNKDDQEMLFHENEELHLKIEDLKKTLNLNEEALNHATVQFNLDLGTVSSENSKLKSNLEKESSTREKVETEVDSLKTRLQSTSDELDKAHHARTELERSSHRQLEDASRQLERRETELSHLKDTNQSIQQRLTEAESKYTRIENELHIGNATLTERTNQLSTLQRELDGRRTSQETLEESLRKEKEENTRLQTKMEGYQDRLTSLQQELVLVRQQLDEARQKAVGGERDGGDRFSAMLTTMQGDHEKSRIALEEKNVLLTESITRLREEVHTADNRRVAVEQELRHLHTELADATRKQSVAEASLEVANRSKEHLESERSQLRGEMERLQSRLDSAKQGQLEAQVKITGLMESLERSQTSHATAAQQLATHAGNLETATRSRGEIGDSLHKLELENAKLEATLKHESQKVEMLQRELADSNQVRGTLEALTGNLKTTIACLEEKFADAAATRTVASLEAQDNKALWESEVKSRSKLGLRIAQLEREKTEGQQHLGEEKRKARKAVDQKKSSEGLLQSEQDKSARLEKEVNTLKAHLKLTRKRLKDLDTSDNKINILQSDFDKERLEMERTLNSVRRQLESAQGNVENEVDMRDKLELKTRQLHAELETLRSMEKSYGKMERAKRKLEEDLTMYRTHINTNYTEKSDLDHLRAELEAKARLELNQKLEDVNKYLEEQARARAKLDNIREKNEMEAKKEFERTRKDLLGELNTLRTDYQTTLSHQVGHEHEAKRFKDLYESEQKLRERLTSRLEKANERASSAQVFIESQRLSQAGSSNGWLNNSAYGKPSSGHGINDVFSNKIKQELDRSIAKHMEKGPHIDIDVPLRSLDDSGITRSYDKSRSDYLSVLQKNYHV